MGWITLTTCFLLTISSLTKKLHQNLGLLTLLCLIYGFSLSYLNQTPSLKEIRILSEISLIFFLFLDGIRLHIPKIIHYHKQALRQITLGFFIQTFLGSVLAYFFLNLPFKDSTLLSLALATIDLKIAPTSINNKQLPTRIAQILNIETSGSCLIAVFFFMILKDETLFDLIFPALMGLVIGLCIIYLTSFTLKSNLTDRSFLVSHLFISPFVVFYFAKSLQWNGYIAVITLGLTLGHLGRSLCDGTFDFGKQQGTLLFFLFIILFGFQMSDLLTYSLTFQTTCYAIFSLFIVRTIATFFSFLGSKFQWKTLFFCSFFGPRALTSAALGLLFFPHHLSIYKITYSTIFISLLIHTLSSFLITYCYTHSIPKTAKSEHLPTISLPH